MEFLNDTFSMIPSIVSTAPVVLNLTINSLILAVVVGLIAALIRIGRVPILNQLVIIFIELLRGTPLLVQLV